MDQPSLKGTTNLSLPTSVCVLVDFNMHCPLHRQTRNLSTIGSYHFQL